MTGAKRRRFEAVLAADTAADSDADSDDAAGASDEEAEEGEDEQQEQQQQQEEDGRLKKKLHVSATALKGGKGGAVCHVCGKAGHRAGFVGPIYIDCPNKACFLCRQPGHTTATCPHNLAVGRASSEGGGQAGGSSRDSVIHRLLQRERSGRQSRGPMAALSSPRWQVDAAILKLHTRRVTCLAFPVSSESHVISGDKRGGIAVWNFTQVHDRVLYDSIHSTGGVVNGLAPSPWLPGGFDCASASADGTVKLFDVETGMSQQLANLNPDGWQGSSKLWRMFHAVDTNQELQLVLAGDSEGCVHMLDPRTHAPVNVLQLHKPGSKVNAVSVNPAGGARVVLTGGNDHTARLFDLRKLSSVGQHAAAAAAAAAAGNGSNSRQQSASPAAAAAAAGRGDEPTSPPAAAAAAAGGGGGRGRGRSSSARGRGRSKGRAASPSPTALDAAGGSPGSSDAPAAGRGRGRGRGRSSGRGGAATSPAAAAAASGGGGRGGRGKNSAAAAAAAAASTAQLACLEHGRVVNAAAFSPSGRKILTTCQDNRLRVWDSLLALNNSLAPSRVIVHSHDFNRYLTPFKASWFPSDPSESLILCGRYISERFGEQALHPIDIIDASTGRLLAALVDAHLDTIVTVNLPHPRLDVIISGSSRSLYKWVVQEEEDDVESEGEAEQDGVGSSAGAAAMAAAAAAAAGGGSVRRGGFQSAHFVAVDADPQGGGSKGKGKKGAAAAGNKTATKKAAAKTKAAAGGKPPRKRGRTSSSSKKAAADEDEEQTDEAGSDDE